MGIIVTILRPFLPYIVVGLIGFLGLTTAYYKVRHDENVRVMQQIEQEKSDAIAKARDARSKFFDLCNTLPNCRVPDDWFRD
jgi:hypothetical protein